VAPHSGRAGGGTLPDVSLPGWALKIEPASGSAAELEAALRGGEVPIVARVSEDAVWIDVRAFLPGDDDRTVERLDTLLGSDA
jgi:L-seryl-tRNA(Ser) seleniumtransferase